MLSHTAIAPSSWAAAMMAGRSATSSIGLVGDSAQSRSAPRSAAVTAAVSLMSTRRTVIRPASARSSRITPVPL